MCRVYKAHKGDMLEKNTLPPIPCMQPEKGLYNRHDRSSQSFFNFLEEKITHKNIVGLYNSARTTMFIRSMGLGSGQSERMTQIVRAAGGISYGNQHSMETGENHEKKMF